MSDLSVSSDPGAFQPRRHASPHSANGSSLPASKAARYSSCSSTSPGRMVYCAGRAGPTEAEPMPLMRALAKTPDVTVAQFGQAVGAMYYALS